MRKLAHVGRKVLRLAVGLAVVGVAVHFWAPGGREANAEVICRLGYAAGFLDPPGATVRDPEPREVRVNGVPFLYEVLSVPDPPKRAAEKFLETWARHGRGRWFIPYRDAQPDWEVVSAVMLDPVPGTRVPGTPGAQPVLRGTAHAAVILGDDGERASRVLHAWTPEDVPLDELVRKPAAGGGQGAGPVEVAGAEPLLVIEHEDSGYPVRAVLYRGGAGLVKQLSSWLTARGWNRLAMGRKDSADGNIRIFTRPGGECMVGSLGDRATGFAAMVVRDSSAAGRTR